MARNFEIAASDLRALHMALMEAKLGREVENERVPSSPILARICDALIEAIIENEAGTSLADRSGWDEWRRAESHPHRIENVRAYLPLVDGWERMADEDRRLCVENTLRPLIGSEHTISSLVESTNESHGLSSAQPAAAAVADGPVACFAAAKPTPRQWRS